MPYSVWTIPEIATVGETEESLMSRAAFPSRRGDASFRQNARGQILGDTEGFLKLVFPSGGPASLLGVDDRRRRVRAR